MKGHLTFEVVHSTFEVAVASWFIILLSAPVSFCSLLILLILGLIYISFKIFDELFML